MKTMRIGCKYYKHGCEVLNDDFCNNGCDKFELKPEPAENLLDEVVTLRRCPFCGGDTFTDFIEPHKHHLAIEVPDKTGWSITIECKNCPACMLVNGSSKKDVIKNAKELWNQRYNFA